MAAPIASLPVETRPQGPLARQREVLVPPERQETCDRKLVWLLLGLAAKPQDFRESPSFKTALLCLLPGNNPLP